MYMRRASSRFDHGKPLRQTQRCRPAVETLEDRCLLTAVIALDTDNNLLRFDSTNPTAIQATIPIQGLLNGEQVVGIDVLRGDGRLFGLAVDGATGTAGRILFLDPFSGATVNLQAANIPADPNGTFGFGFDFDPTTTSTARIVQTAGTNIQVDLFTQVQTNNPGLNANKFFEAVAYDRNVPNSVANATTLYGIDSVNGQLVTINTATGADTVVGNLGVPIDNTSFIGFDIGADSRAARGEALAVFDGDPTGGVAVGLYRIKLNTGAATLVGLVGNGLPGSNSANFGPGLMDIALLNQPREIYTNQYGDATINFNLANPGDRGLFSLYLPVAGNVRVQATETFVDTALDPFLSYFNEVAAGADATADDEGYGRDADLTFNNPTANVTHHIEYQDFFDSNAGLATLLVDAPNAVSGPADSAIDPPFFFPNVGFTRTNGLFTLNLNQIAFNAGQAASFVQFRAPISGVYTFQVTPPVGRETSVLLFDYRGNPIAGAFDAPIDLAGPGGTERISIFLQGGRDFFLRVNNPRGKDPSFVDGVTMNLAGQVSLDNVGAFRNGLFFLDADGSHSFGQAGDASFAFGQAGDIPVAGNFSGKGADSVGVFRNGSWIIDSNNSFGYNAGDLTFFFGAPGDQPVVGDWNGDGKDEIGVFRNGNWYLDFNGDGTFGAGDTGAYYGQAGDQAAVGDWNGDGKDEIGIFRNGNWLLDANGTGTFDAGDLGPYFGQFGDLVAPGDWNGDGTTEIGILRNGVWYLDVNNSGGFNAGDVGISLGQAGDRPVVGQWPRSSPLRPVQAAPANHPAAAPLSQAQVQPVLAQAISIWASTGLDSATVAKLGQVQVYVGNLQGGILGQAFDHAIYLDDDAAGWGWFVDPTPGADEEYALDSGVLTAAGGAAAGRMDLLTALVHEIGHVLGRADQNPLGATGDAMAATLAPGVRRTVY